MSYDIYCYRSVSGTPNVSEAEAALEAAEEITPGEDAQALKRIICSALLAFNPKLEAFNFDHDEISRLRKITVEAAKKVFDDIELNTGEGEAVTQIVISDNHVALTIPYWYSGDKAAAVFATVDQYLKIICRAAGYFVYDPQTGSAYDPSEKDFNGLSTYQKITGSMATPVAEKPAGKPWWKFW